MATIMVVEDNELSRDALSRRLERRGYRSMASRRSSSRAASGPT
jgi:CheY-like chemotaxis protein